jgi:hypothetical protein
LLLDAEDDITVVGEAANGIQAVDRARATRPVHRHALLVVSCDGWHHGARQTDCDPFDPTTWPATDARSRFEPKRAGRSEALTYAR